MAMSADDLHATFVEIALTARAMLSESFAADARERLTPRQADQARAIEKAAAWAIELLAASRRTFALNETTPEGQATAYLLNRDVQHHNRIEQLERRLRAVEGIVVP